MTEEEEAWIGRPSHFHKLESKVGAMNDASDAEYHLCQHFVEEVMVMK